jgi:hypothetical protein
VLNQAAAKQFFPERDAVGQQVVDSHDKTSYEVVAVVGDAKYRDVRTPAPPAGYVPILQDEQSKPSLSAVVRIDGPQAPLVAAARSIAARLALTIPAPAMTTVEEVMHNSLSAERTMALLTAFFTGCVLLVTAIGLYGTLAYSTARRISEIGIRMALGAQRAGVVALVCRANALVALAGCAVGLLAARAFAGFLYETSPHDPWIPPARLLCLRPSPAQHHCCGRFAPHASSRSPRFVVNSIPTTLKAGRKQITHRL